LWCRFSRSHLPYIAIIATANITAQIVSSLAPKPVNSAHLIDPPKLPARTLGGMMS
jgi:hypothetical protein